MSNIEKVNYEITELNDSDIGEFYFYNNLLEYPEIAEQYEELEKRIIAAKAKILKNTNISIFNTPIRFSLINDRPVIIY